VKNFCAAVTIVGLMALAQVIGAGVMVQLGSIVEDMPFLRDEFLVWLVVTGIALACGLFFLAGSIPCALKFLMKMKG